MSLQLILQSSQSILQKWVIQVVWTSATRVSPIWVNPTWVSPSIWTTAVCTHFSGVLSLVNHWCGGCLLDWGWMVYTAVTVSRVCGSFQAIGVRNHLSATERTAYLFLGQTGQILGICLHAEEIWGWLVTSLEVFPWGSLLGRSLPCWGTFQWIYMEATVFCRSEVWCLCVLVGLLHVHVRHRQEQRSIFEVARRDIEVSVLLLVNRLFAKTLVSCFICSYRLLSYVVDALTVHGWWVLIHCTCELQWRNLALSRWWLHLISGCQYSLLGHLTRVQGRCDQQTLILDGRLIADHHKW